MGGDVNVRVTRSSHTWTQEIRVVVHFLGKPKHCIRTHKGELEHDAL